MSCPSCFNPLNEGNRLVTESCGHVKCRKCLISEENGCIQCLANDILFETPNVAIAHKPLETSNEKLNRTETERTENVKADVKKTRTRFPAHIVRRVTNGTISYACKVCNRNFKSRSQQYYHVYCNDSKNKPFKCTECNLAFSSSYHLKYHSDEHKNQTYQCSLCMKKFSNLRVFQKHKKLHNESAKQCPECGARFRDPYSYKAHIDKHNNVFAYACELCDKKCSSKSNLKQHQLSHAMSKRFKCNDCPKEFHHKSTYSLHLVKHKRIKTIKCLQCDKEFLDQKSMNRHNRIHMAKSQFKCVHCEAKSIRRDNLARHVKNMHPDQNLNASIQVVENSSLDNAEYNISNDPSITTNPPDEVAIEEPPLDGNEILIKSSVIRSVGNAKPMTVSVSSHTDKEESPVPAVTTEKKLKRKYDPCEMYRKILLDDDDERLSDRSKAKTPENQQEENPGTSTKNSGEAAALNHSNFSEMHWRKNFKYTYQFQYD